MERILKIQEFSEGERYNKIAGFKITTNKQVIKLYINDSNNCCEKWDYLMSEDCLEYFIYSELHGIKEDGVSKGNNKKIDSIDLDNGGSMFIDIITSKGVLQFACYNSHNGYYSHSACVESNQLNLSESL
jgi:hypothetical protein